MNIFDALLTHNWLRDFYYSYGSCKRPYAVVEAICDLQHTLFKAKVVFEK